MRFLLALLFPWMVQAQLNTNTPWQVLTYSNVTDVITRASPFSANRTFFTMGRINPNDGGGGNLIYDPLSTSATNLGTVFQFASAGGRLLREFSGAYNVKWFGAIAGDGIDDLPAFQAAVNASLSTTNGGEVFIPTGRFDLYGTLNLQDSSNLIIRGEGRGKTIIWCRSITGSPGFDMMNAHSIQIKDLEFCMAHSDPLYPTTAILYGRADNTIQSGNHTFDNLYIHGSYTFASTYGISSEENTFIKCEFNNDIMSTNDLVYAADSATNRQGRVITSPFIPITTEGRVGNGFNAYRQCRFMNYSTNNLQRSLVMEFGQATVLDNADFYSNGATNIIELRYSTVGFQMIAPRVEYHPDATTNPVTIWLGTPDAFRDIHVTAGAITPVKGMDGATLVGFTMTGSHWAGQLTPQQYAIDVSGMVATYVNISDAGVPAGRYFSDGLYRARDQDVGSLFVHVPANRLQLAGHDYTTMQQLKLLGDAVIQGPGQNTTAVTDAGAKGGKLLLLDTAGDLGSGYLAFGGGSSAREGAGIKAVLVNNNVSDLSIVNRRAPADTTMTLGTVFKANGNVGIGTNAPTDKLVVLGNTTITGTNMIGQTRWLFDSDSYVDASIDGASRLTFTHTPPANAWMIFQGMDGVPNAIFKGSTVGLRLSPQANGYALIAGDQNGFGLGVPFLLQGSNLRFDTTFGLTATFEPTGVLQLENRLRLKEITAPATNTIAGYSDIYLKSDGRVYNKDEAGVEYGPFGAGDISTASNLGAGTVGPFNSKLTSDLRFNSMAAGAGITLSSNANVITITASASAVITRYIVLSLSDPTVALTAPLTNYIRFPVSWTLTGVSGSLLRQGSSSTVLELKKNGTTVLSAPITMVSGNTNTVGAISVSAVAANDALVGEVTTAGTGAYGAQVVISYTIP